MESIIRKQRKKTIPMTNSYQDDDLTPEEMCLIPSIIDKTCDFFDPEDKKFLQYCSRLNIDDMSDEQWDLDEEFGVFLLFLHENDWKFPLTPETFAAFFHINFIDSETNLSVYTIDELALLFGIEAVRIELMLDRLVVDLEYNRGLK
jgi:hypothetical protein